MRVILTGDRDWYAYDLAEEVVTRLLVKYGPGLVIVHGGATGIDRAFAEAWMRWASSRRLTPPAGMI